MTLEDAVSMTEGLKKFYDSNVFWYIYWLYLIPTSLMLLHEVMRQVWEECHGRVRHRISIVCFVPVVNVLALILIVIVGGYKLLNRFWVYESGI